jgi:hypothetical protein
MYVLCFALFSRSTRLLLGSPSGCTGTAQRGAPGTGTTSRREADHSRPIRRRMMFSETSSQLVLLGAWHRLLGSKQHLEMRAWLTSTPIITGARLNALQDTGIRHMELDLPCGSDNWFSQFAMSLRLRFTEQIVLFLAG